MRSVIAESWQRAATSGLLPESSVRADICVNDRDTALLRAADPVITDLAQQLEETSCALLLADRTQRIVLSRFHGRHVGRALDDVAAVPGSVYTEHTSGTNAISTVFETGQGSFVLGEEHYLDQLRRFRCYGHPIRHPITGVLEGVLDITGLRADSEGLMRALVVSTARAIEGRLLLASPSAQTRLLSAFQTRAARSRHGVVAFGRDLALSNDAAGRFLDETVVEELKAACASQLQGSGERSIRIMHPQRTEQYEAHIVPVEGAQGSFVVEVTVRRSPDEPRLARPPAASGVDTNGNLLVEGEPGSGRSTVAQARLNGAAAIHIDAATGPREAVQMIGTATARSVLVLENADCFDGALAAGVAAAAATSGVRVVGTVEDSSSHMHAALARLFTCHEVVLPLRRRLHELPGIAREILRASEGELEARISTAAMDRLLRYSWPGNITELKAVLVEARPSARGLIDIDHLPTRVAFATSRRLSPLEEAEYRTLLDALGRHGGNKSHVAQELGIGRSTLYRRLRSLGLPA